MKELLFIGANFRSAAASERQHLALPSDQMTALLRAISERIPGAEFCMLSTCNRAEFYLVGPKSTGTPKALSKIIGSHCPGFEQLLASGKIAFKQGLQAYEHLLRVSCGLESAVLGETQIVQQIRHALQMAREAGCTGAHLEQAFGRALSLASRVRSETDISTGSPGVAAAICETITARQPLGSPKSQRVLLIGAGAINSSVARLLAHNEAFQLTVVNRSEARAQSLALQYSGRALPWSELAQAIAQAEVIVAATSSAKPVVTDSMLEATADAMHPRARKLFVDAGMPPNVERSARSAFDIVGIDQLSQRQDRHLNRRRAAIPQVERYIESELASWNDWLAQRPLENVLKSLYLDLETLPQRLSQHFQGARSSTSDELQYIIHRHIKQLLHPHVMDLRRMVRAKASYSHSAIK